MNKKHMGLCVILFGTSIFYFFEIDNFLSFEWLKDNQRLLEIFYQSNPLTVMVCFVSLFLFIGLFLLPGATLLSVFSGAVFGLPLGPLLVSVGSTLGALLAFYVARYILKNWVEERFGERLHPIQEGLCKNDIHYMLFLRLVPIAPFFLVNIAMGASRISWKVFMAGTLLGKLPAIWIYANAGSNLANLRSLADVNSPRIIVALTLLCLLTLIPVIYKKIKNSKRL